MFNKNSFLLTYSLFLLLALTIFSQKNINKVLVNDSYKVTILSPADVQLKSGVRFFSRYQGNVKYLLFQHEVFGQEMIYAFASRHYSPGKLLERMWDIFVTRLTVLEI
jgi:hypothetical protein